MTEVRPARSPEKVPKRSTLVQRRAAQMLSQLSDQEWTQLKRIEDRRRADQRVFPIFKADSVSLHVSVD
jgi:hypothetical protein